MSIEAMAWAWSVEDLTPTERLALIAIADYADEKWSCFPGQERLAKRVCVSTRTIIRTLQALEERGLIRRERRSRSDGTRTSDLFILRQGDNLSRDARGGDKVTTVSPQEPSVEPSVITNRVRAARLVEGWRPRKETITAIQSECPGLDVEREHRKFEDYWLSAGGQNASKKDWDRTWKNWMRTAYERQPRQTRGSGTKRMSRVEENLAMHHRLFGGQQVEQGRSIEALDLGISEGWASPD